MRGNERTPDQIHAGVVEVFDNAVPNCEELVEFLDTHNQGWEDARVGGQSGGAVIKETRDNQVASFQMLAFSNPPILHDFAKTVWEYLNDYAERYGFGFSYIENVNVNRYAPGEQYLAHADDGPGFNRVVSALVYLNDVERGGETEFVHFDVSVSPKAGRLVIFPANYAYAHAARPTVDTVKYSLAIWCNK